MLKSAKPKRIPTFTDTAEIRELLQDIYGYHGTTTVKTAMLISACVFVRPSELTDSKWSYIDFKRPHWIIPTKYMKMKRDHLIPFPRQVRALPESLLSITGKSEYIFPTERDHTKSINSQTVNKTLRVLHGGNIFIAWSLAVFGLWHQLF